MGDRISMGKKEKEEICCEDLDIIPFGNDEPDTYTMFKCGACGYEELVPDFIIDESFVPEEFAENGSPIVLCPKCEGDMIIKPDEV